MKYVLLATFLLVHEAPSGFAYPWECCGGKDCKPVPCDSLTETKEGVTWEGVLFRGKQIRPSEDSQCHVCVGGLKPHLSPWCVFVQPSS